MYYKKEHQRAYPVCYHAKKMAKASRSKMKVKNLNK